MEINNIKKNYINFRKINNRYILFDDKSEKQISINNNFNKLSNSNLYKANKIYNSNYFSVNNNNNKLRNNKASMKNYNHNNLKLKALDNIQKPSINNIKLYVTNFKNINTNFLAYKKEFKRTEKEENKYINKINYKDKVKDPIDNTPTIVKIQKLIEILQNKNSVPESMNLIEKLNFENINNNSTKANENILNNNNKKKEKLPSLINNDIKLSNIKTQKNEFTNNKIFPMKDMVNRVNHTKIKLKNLNHDRYLNINNISNKNKEEHSHNIKIKAKDLPAIKRKPKVSIDKIKNVIKEKLIIDNNGFNEKIVNIRLKSNNNQYYINTPVYQNNSLSLMKSQKDSVNFCISNYNNFKSNLMTLKQTFHNIENERTKKEKFFNKNNTMFKNPLNENKFNEANEEYESEENDSKGFSKYFLPSSGFGLLQRNNN